MNATQRVKDKYGGMDDAVQKMIEAQRFKSVQIAAGHDRCEITPQAWSEIQDIAAKAGLVRPNYVVMSSEGVQRLVAALRSAKGVSRATAAAIARILNLVQVAPTQSGITIKGIK
jgi:hypothetical protein